MNVCVQGLWHLGCVTAACLAALGHEVVGYDADTARIDALNAGRAPLMEPGLDALIAAGIAAQRLRFSADRHDAARHADALWITYDTPVDEDDVADTGWVIAQAQAMLTVLPNACLVVVSSQLPVGSVARLERHARAHRPDADFTFAAVPENLRLGKAIDVFTRPDRIVAGVRDGRARERVAPLLATITDRIEWMGVESAEMTKHAINAFLALSVTFANELATLCEAVGADAKEVERGLKTETRIGPRAYLAPGAAFAGGTLARDVAFLGTIAAEHGQAAPLLHAVKRSNDAHQQWTARTLERLITPLAGARIALWGLTYKPGTDTLRRSAAVALCRVLLDKGARVTVHDPVAGELADALAAVDRVQRPLDALHDAQALVVCTEWPEYRAVTAQSLAEAAPGIRVVDPNRFLAHLAGCADISYHAVGTPGSGG
jgi:UDPglucose 6-dehydrogenase